MDRACLLDASPAATSAAVEVALGADRPWTGGVPLPSLAQSYNAAGQALPEAFAPWSAAPATRVYLGHDFCEHLLPRPSELEAALRHAADAGLGVALATPLASDACIARIRRLLPLLPEGTEVVCNDWGTAALVRRERPALRVIAGRQLCRMIKDPRLPSAQWAGLYPHGLASPGLGLLLARFDVAGIELDVPPYADAAFFEALPLPAAVHAPWGYSAKGRSCKLAGLGQRGPTRFAPGQACARECLDYGARTRRAKAGPADLPTAQIGNALHYAHSPAMSAALAAAVAQGRVARLVLSGG